MEITSNQNKAVNEIVEMVVSVIGNGSREINTAEAISSTARLAGSFLFRSFELKIDDVKTGTVLLSEEANTKGPQLVNITHAVLQNFGVQLDNSKMTNGHRKMAESSFVEVIGKVQTPALEIMKRNDLNYEQMAQAAAIATAFIIQQSNNISPEEGFGTAIYYYIEGTKTFPPAFTRESEGATNARTVVKENADPVYVSKSWWEFWK